MQANQDMDSVMQCMHAGTARHTCRPAVLCLPACRQTRTWMQAKQCMHANKAEHTCTHTVHACRQTSAYMQPQSACSQSSVYMQARSLCMHATVVHVDCACLCCETGAPTLVHALMHMFASTRKMHLRPFICSHQGHRPLPPHFFSFRVSYNAGLCTTTQLHQVHHFHHIIIHDPYKYLIQAIASRRKKKESGKTNNSNSFRNTMPHR